MLIWFFVCLFYFCLIVFRLFICLFCFGLFVFARVDCPDAKVSGANVCLVLPGGSVLRLSIPIVRTIGVIYIPIYKRMETSADKLETLRKIEGIRSP